VTQRHRSYSGLRTIAVLCALSGLAAAVLVVKSGERLLVSPGIDAGAVVTGVLLVLVGAVVARRRARRTPGVSGLLVVGVTLLVVWAAAGYFAQGPTGGFVLSAAAAVQALVATFVVWRR